MASRRNKMANPSDIFRLKRLKERIERSDSVSVTELESVLDVLDAARIPASSEPPIDGRANRNVNLAIAALKIIDACSSYFPRNDALVAKVDEMLLDIWQWADFILMQFFLADVYSEALVRLARKDILESLFLICTEDTLRAHILERTDILEKVTFYWLDQGKVAKRDDLDRLANILQRLLIGRGVPDESLQAMLLAANGDHRRLVRAALRRAKQPFDWNEADVAGLCSNLKVLTWIVHNGDHKMVDAILDAGGISIALACLDRLQSRRVPQYLVDGQRFVASACLAIFWKAASVSSDPYHWVLDMIKRGFMQSAARISMLEPASHEEDRVNFVSAFETAIDAVAPFTVYYSVVHAIMKGFYRRPPVSVAHSPLGNLWQMIPEVCQAREKHMDVFEEVYLGKCHFCHTSSPKALKLLKRCAGCASPRYCSIRCQRADWHSHRVLCLPYQRTLAEGEESPIPLHEQSFVLGALNNELRATAKNSKSAAGDEPLPVPLTHLVLSYDFRALPPKTDVFPLHEYNRRYGRDLTPHEDLMLLLVQVPWGERGATLQRFIPPPKGLL